jgi:phosphomannomutase
MVEDFPELEFIGGGEESFGFMVGDFVRDKDAVTSSLLACEVAAQQKAKSRTLFEYLDTIYKDVGYYREHLVSLKKKEKKVLKKLNRS